MYRRWKESGGKDDEYKTIIVRQVKTSQTEALKDGVTSESLKNKNHESDITLWGFVTPSY